MNAALVIIGLTTLVRAGARPGRASRRAHDPRAMDGRGARLRRPAGVPAAPRARSTPPSPSWAAAAGPTGAARRPITSSPTARSPISCPTGCCRRSGATPSSERLISQSHFFAQQIRQPMAWGARRAGRRRRAGALSGAAVPGPRHHRLGRLLRLDLADRGDLDRRGDGDDLRHDLRHARRGVERRGQGRAHPRRRACFSASTCRCIITAAIGEMFHAIDAAKPGFLDLQADRPERAVVPVDGDPDGARLLHVAARVLGRCSPRGASRPSAATPCCCRSIS